jgi:hypothetical protein
MKTYVLLWQNFEWISEIERQFDNVLPRDLLILVFRVPAHKEDYSAKYC